MGNLRSFFPLNLTDFWQSEHKTSQGFWNAKKFVWDPKASIPSLSINFKYTQRLNSKNSSQSHLLVESPSARRRWWAQRWRKNFGGGLPDPPWDFRVNKWDLRRCNTALTTCFMYEAAEKSTKRRRNHLGTHKCQNPISAPLVQDKSYTVRWGECGGGGGGLHMFPWGDSGNHYGNERGQITRYRPPSPAGTKKIAAHFG